jgi:hypothetical protein
VRKGSLRVALLLALACRLAAQQPPSVVVTVSGSTGSAGFTPEAVSARLTALVNGLYGEVLTVVQPGSLPAGGAGGGTPPAAAAITLSAGTGTITARTQLTRGTSTAVRSVTAVLASPAALLPALASDLALLATAAAGFANVPLSPPPALEAALFTETLGLLAGWNPEDTEPVGIAGTDGSLAVAFPRGWITLGRSFSLTVDTARDLLAQEQGGEPLQLSGIVRRRAGGLALVSEREGKVTWIDPRLGTRRISAVPGIPAGHAEELADGTLAVLAGGAVSSWGDGEAGAAFGGPPLASAFTTDGEGNLWAWDARESRVRVFSREGAEIHGVRPLARSAALQFPQALAVFDDGSFLLGGAGELWKFRPSGAPAWRLTRIGGTAGESLPSSFQLAVDRKSGAFTLLDGPSRRLLCFAADSSAPGPTGDGLLLALQEGLLAEKRGSPGPSPAAARTAVARARLTLFARVAAAAREDLLLDQADHALRRASEAAREVLADDPADDRTARELERLVAERRWVRESLAPDPPVSAARSRAVLRHLPRGCSLAVTLVLRNSGSLPLRGVRLSLAAPGISAVPALAEVGALAPGQEKASEMVFPLPGPDVPAGTSIPAAALVSWERAAEGGSTAIRLVLAVEPPPRAEAAALLAAGLAARVDPDEPLVRAAVFEISAGIEDGMSAAALVLDVLGRLRAFAAAAGGGGIGAGHGVRAALRGLSRDALDWSLLTADVLAALGLPVGVLAWPDTAVVLLDTGIPLGKALAALPALAREEAVLAGLSRDGRLVVPLSGELPSPQSPQAPSILALLAGLRTCRERGGSPRTAVQGFTAWTGGSGTPPPARPQLPLAFPARFPFVTGSLDREKLAAAVIAALEQKR